MSWLLNLWMLGKGAPPNTVSFTQLSPNGVMGRPYNITAKAAAGVFPSPFYYMRFLGRFV